MYRLPNKDNIHYVVGKAEESGFKDALTKGKGFLFSPAANSLLHKSYTITPNAEFVLTDADTDDFSWFDWPISTNQPIITSRHDYLNQALGMIWAMQENQLKKAILSRILRHPTHNFDPYKTFIALCEKYPQIMVYLVAIPSVGTWIGATPETLVQIINDKASTMALAGTQKDTGSNPDKVLWGNKEQEEQQIVTDNIKDLIQSHFPLADIKVDGPNTVSTGALLHINTQFEWNVGEDYAAIASFVNDLHPTPAIVGEPRAEALNLIAHSETHDRAYYTGLLGPVNLMNVTHLFVNLRCMQVFDGYVALYVGGGLTANSHPEAEWQETELKAKTLLQVLQS